MSRDVKVTRHTIKETYSKNMGIIKYDSSVHFSSVFLNIFLKIRFD